MYELIVCFGRFKIVLVDCSDWELIRILKEVIGQKKNKTKPKIEWPRGGLEQHHQIEI